MSHSRQLFRRPLVDFRQSTRDIWGAKSMRTCIDLIYDLLRCFFVKIIHHNICAT